MTTVISQQNPAQCNVQTSPGRPIIKTIKGEQLLQDLMPSITSMSVPFKVKIYDNGKSLTVDLEQFMLKSATVKQGIMVYNGFIFDASQVKIKVSMDIDISTI